MNDKAKLKVLSEETVKGDSDAAEENPYWLAEDIEEHPDPSLGCIRRGLCCKSNPGWFAPGEVEQAAELLGTSPDRFVREYLVIDFVELDGERVEVFAPVKLDRKRKPLSPTGKRVDRLYQMLRSPCVFYVEQGCRIYDARPLECRRYLCTAADGENLSHKEIAAMWRDGSSETE